MFPPAPLETINWNKLGIAVNDSVNGHVESYYHVETGEWSEPTFVADPYLRIHGLSPALNYGQQAYEGLKALRGPDEQINIFRASMHAARLSHSASYVSIPAIPDAHFMKAVKLAVARNAVFVAPHVSEALLYIRPLVFGSSGHLALTAPTEFTFAVYAQPGTTYHGVQPLDCLVLEEFDRAAPHGTGSAKVGGNYAPVVKWSDAARRQGFGITLHLDAATHTQIEEFSTSGFIGVKKSKPGEAEKEKEEITLVVPDSQNIVQSVTSDSCMTIASSLGWKVEKRAIPWTECSTFSEVIAVGTAASLVPIKSITRKSTSDKFGYGAEIGPCTQELGRRLKETMKAIVPNPWDWLERVEEKDLLLEEPGALVDGIVNGGGDAFVNGSGKKPVVIA